MLGGDISSGAQADETKLIHVLDTSHGMTEPFAWTWSYVLKCSPPLGWILYMNEHMKLNVLNYSLDKFKPVRSPR